jgi:hypothetical protein
MWPGGAKMARSGGPLVSAASFAAFSISLGLEDEIIKIRVEAIGRFL